MLLFVKQARQKAAFFSTQVLASAALGRQAASEAAMAEYRQLCFPFIDSFTVDRDKKAKELLDWWSGQGQITFKATKAKGERG